MSLSHHRQIQGPTQAPKVVAQIPYLSLMNRENSLISATSCRSFATETYPILLWTVYNPEQTYEGIA